jgi:hypothetical protein
MKQYRVLPCQGLSGVLLPSERRSNVADIQTQSGDDSHPYSSGKSRLRHSLEFYVVAALMLASIALLEITGLTRANDLASAQPAAPVESASVGVVTDESNTTAAEAPPKPITSDSGSVVTTTVGTESFWRLAQTSDGVWWFLSPQGELEWLNTVTTVVPFQLGRRLEGPHFVSTDYPGDAQKLIEGHRDPTNLKAWADKTWQRVQAAGFKGMGAWSHPIFHEMDVPVTRDLNAWAYVPRDQWRLYSAGWSSTVEEAIKRQVTVLRDNRNLVGYYIDNELDWNDSGAGPAFYFDHLSPQDPNRLMVISVIKRLWPDIDSFNRAWNMQLESFDQLLTMEKLPHEPPAAYGQLFSAWIEQLAGDYFRITTNAIRAHDPNHLILGVRFRGHAPEEVVRASKNYTHAQSINYYVGDALLDRDMFDMMHRESGQPVIITEYSFHSLDGRSGNRNTFGFVAQVLDQQARADGYRTMTANLARLPYVIGAEWFQWADEPPSGRTFDGEDVNFGVVDIDDRPYDMLVRAVRETAPLLNSMHSRASSDTLTGVFRSSLGERRIAEFRYLEKSPRINGELSDWSEEHRLQGIRRSDVLGLDRSTLPLPNVFVGWRPEGLYFGIEVFDNDIQGIALANGWWTRDNVELFISTRDVEPDQRFYTPHEHQFFHVPIAFPGPDGVSGITGRFQRTGDGMSSTLFPDSKVKDATRVFPDRYVIELLIPKESLHGYDPEKSPYISFNFTSQNFQGALAYFWSAPKELHTQLRPGTWGRVFLRPHMTPQATTTGG